MIRKSFRVPIYFGKVTVILSKDLSEIEKEFNLLDTSDVDAFCFRPLSGNGYVICFKHFELQLISHEVVHLVNMIFKTNGIKPDLENDEPQAYLHGYLFEKILNILNQNR